MHIMWANIFSRINISVLTFRHNEDGSYSYGYEAADGSFKLETRYPDGRVKGKYGYIDIHTGELKVKCSLQPLKNSCAWILMRSARDSWEELLCVYVFLLLRDSLIPFALRALKSLREFVEQDFLTDSFGAWVGRNEQILYLIFTGDWIWCG